MSLENTMGGPAQPKEKVENEAEEAEKKIDEILLKLQRVFKSLAPNDREEEEFKKNQLESLLDDTKKHFELRGAVVTPPLVFYEKAEEILIHRLHAIIDDSHKKRSKKSPDPELLRRTNLVLLVEHDNYVGGRYAEDIKDKDLHTLTFRIRGWGEDRSPLSEREINLLVEAGYGETLSVALGRNSFSERKYIPEFVPESLLSFYLSTSKFDYNTLELIFRSAIIEKRKYSKKIFDTILNSKYSYYCLRFFEVFEDADILKTLKNSQNITYPYYAKDQINTTRSLKLDTPEVIKEIIKNNWVTLSHSINDKEALERYPEYKDILEKTNGLPSNDQIERGIDLEDGIQIARELIKSGNLGFLHEKKSLWKWLLENEYDWLIEEVVKHKQEHLLLMEMKPETQIAYIERLIASNDKTTLFALFTGDRNSGFFKDQLFDEVIYSKLIEIIPAESLNLEQFRNLPPEIYRMAIGEEGLRGYTLRDGKIYRLINSFNFEKEGFNKEKEYQDYIQKLNSELGIQSDGLKLMNRESPIYFSKFQELTKEEKKRWFLIFENLHLLSLGTINKESYLSTLKLLTSEPLDSHLLYTLLENDIKSASKYISDLHSLNRIIYGNIDNMYPIYDLQISPKELSGIKTIVSELASILRKAEISNQGTKVLVKEVAVQENTNKATMVSEKIQMLANEVVGREESLKLVYIKTFLVGENSKEDRDKYLDSIEKNIKEVAHNQPIDASGEEYKIICEAVYPQRNYDTYGYMDKYKDRSVDIEKYKFDRSGYGVKLDGVSEYRVKEGEKINPNILEKYSERVKRLSTLGNKEALEKFLDDKLEKTEEMPETLEGKLLKYLEDKSNDEIADTLFAYQLCGEYDEFVQGTRDRVEGGVPQAEKEYIMLAELAERFGDRLKETIREILEKVGNSPDKKFFKSSELGFSEPDISKLGLKITNDLQKIPKERVTDQVVQRKVLVSLINRFQRAPIILEMAEKISLQFTKEDIDFISDKLLQQINNNLSDTSPSDEISGKKIEKIQNECYMEISKELEKYEEVMEADVFKQELGVQEKSLKKRSVRGYFSKNRENAHARMVADVCIAVDEKMLENPNYFEFVLFDEDRNKNIGTVMLLTMNEPEGKKYLLYCPNPSTDILSKISSEKMYQWTTKQIINFAEENGFDGILTDTRHGHATNRPGKFQEALTASVLRGKDDKPKNINLREPHNLTSSNNSYIYQNNLSVIWEK